MLVAGGASYPRMTAGPAARWGLIYRTAGEPRFGEVNDAGVLTHEAFREVPDSVALLWDGSTYVGWGGNAESMAMRRIRVACPEE